MFHLTNLPVQFQIAPVDFTKIIVGPFYPQFRILIFCGTVPNFSNNYHYIWLSIENGKMMKN